MGIAKKAVKRGARAGAGAGKAVGAHKTRLSAATALATLLEVMHGSDKDHVRVSAAKIILARVAAAEEQRMRKSKAKQDENKDDPERQAALNAIAALLDELAAAKVVGVAGKAGVDQGGAG